MVVTANAITTAGPNQTLKAYNHCPSSAMADPQIRCTGQAPHGSVAPKFNCKKWRLAQGMTKSFQGAAAPGVRAARRQSRARQHLPTPASAQQLQVVSVRYSVVVLPVASDNMSAFGQTQDTSRRWSTTEHWDERP